MKNTVRFWDTKGKLSMTPFMIVIFLIIALFFVIFLAEKRATVKYETKQRLLKEKEENQALIRQKLTDKLVSDIIDWQINGFSPVKVPLNLPKEIVFFAEEIFVHEIPATKRKPQQTEFGLLVITDTAFRFIPNEGNPSCWKFSKILVDRFTSSQVSFILDNAKSDIIILKPLNDDELENQEKIARIYAMYKILTGNYLIGFAPEICSIMNVKQIVVNGEVVGKLPQELKLPPEYQHTQKSTSKDVLETLGTAVEFAMLVAKSAKRRR